MNAPLEKDVLRSIKDYLALAGCFVIRVNSAMFAAEYNGRKRVIRSNSEQGCSDLLCCVPVTIQRPGMSDVQVGEFLSLEIKRSATGKASPPQKLFGARVALAGGTWAVVSSVEQVRKILREMGADRVP